MGYSEWGSKGTNSGLPLKDKNEAHKKAHRIAPRSDPKETSAVRDFPKILLPRPSQRAGTRVAGTLWESHKIHPQAAQRPSLTGQRQEKMRTCSLVIGRELQKTEHGWNRPGLELGQVEQALGSRYPPWESQATTKPWLNLFVLPSPPKSNRTPRAEGHIL